MSTSTYLVFDDNNDEEAVAAAIAECSGAFSGKRRITRSTAESKGYDEEAWERARDKKTGNFCSWKDHASELQSQVHGLVKLLEATGLKLGEVRAELSMSDKHLSRREKQIDSMETKHVEDSAKVRAAEHSKAEASCLKLKRLHESVSKQLLTTELALAKQKGMTVAAEAAATDAKSNAKRAKTDAAQALRREAKTRALLEKAEGMVTAGKAEAEKMRKERNKAWAERRGLKESVTKYQSTIASRDKKVAYLERQRGAAEREMGTLAMEVEDVLEDLDDATRLLVAARGKMSELEQRELDLLVAQVNEEEGMLETGASVSLIDALGKKKGERWSQDIIELGMELMEKNLSGQQAESVTRAFVHFQHPHLTENADYRIPSAARFKGTAHCFGFQFLYTKSEFNFRFNLRLFIFHFHFLLQTKTKTKRVEVVSRASLPLPRGFDDPPRCSCSSHSRRNDQGWDLGLPDCRACGDVGRQHRQFPGEVRLAAVRRREDGGGPHPEVAEERPRERRLCVAGHHRVRDERQRRQGDDEGAARAQAERAGELGGAVERGAGGRAEGTATCRRGVVCDERRAAGSSQDHAGPGGTRLCRPLSQFDHRGFTQEDGEGHAGGERGARPCRQRAPALLRGAHAAENRVLGAR